MALVSRLNPSLSLAIQQQNQVLPTHEQVVIREFPIKKERILTEEIAHRGAYGAPENSLASIRLALKQGYDKIEIDIQLSKDQMAVLMHDDTITYTTRNRKKLGRGKYKARVDKLTFKELKKLRLKPERTQYKNEKVPSLKESLDLLYEYNSKRPSDMQAQFILDLKTPKVAEEVFQELLDYQNSYGQWPKVMVQSFSYEALKVFAELESKHRPVPVPVMRTPLGIVVTHYDEEQGTLGRHKMDDLNLKKLEQEGVVSFVNIWGRKKLTRHPLTPEKVEKLNQMRFDVYGWTIHRNVGGLKGFLGRSLEYPLEELKNDFGLKGLVVAKKK